MKLRAEYCNDIFNNSIDSYHVMDDVDAPFINPYGEASIECRLFEKNWIDTVQWHLEDLIRDPDIDHGYGINIKRRIDGLNQMRTNIVEYIDDYYMELFKDIVPVPDARYNTESVGWALDRLSILNLKLFHVNVELARSDSGQAHKKACEVRRSILQQQHRDLMKSINWLLEDIANGTKTIKVYKQLKMYNDISFNPVLYNRMKNVE